MFASGDDFSFELNQFFFLRKTFIWTQKCTSVIKLLKKLGSNWAQSRKDFLTYRQFSHAFHKYSIKMCILLKIWFCILVWIVFSFSLSCFQFWLNFSSILSSLVNDLYKFAKCNYTLIRNEVRKFNEAEVKIRKIDWRWSTTDRLTIKITQTKGRVSDFFHIEIQRHYGISSAAVG